MDTIITSISSHDRRFPLQAGAGSDAVHHDPVYAYAVCDLTTNTAHRGTGLAFVLGHGNHLVCAAIEQLAKPLVGRNIEELMASFGLTFRALADDQFMRWLGPHKGVVHLALSSIVNACWDLWAKSRGVPLWKLLLDLTPSQVAATIDFSYLEDVLTAAQAVELLESELPRRSARQDILRCGYPGYDTSVGWFNYSDEKIEANVKKAIAAGFGAMKIKVGSADPQRDLRRTKLIRRLAGDQATIMVDANQQWTLPQSLQVCAQLLEINPFWVEEPTHPDDIAAHRTLAEAIAPVAVAMGEHVPNRVVFKNYMQQQAASIIQVDAVRVAGVSEFLAVALMARRFGLRVVPHVGDMGQIHQHLVLFNHIAMGHEALFLEYIPHLRQHFAHPAVVANGVYTTPQVAGSSSDLLPPGDSDAR
jgi:L-fuconate dehydratase